jgi:hypothetical protein
MAHKMRRLLTTLLVASLMVLAPSAASAAARPHPPAMERFYCHRIVHPVAMQGYPWRLPTRAYCLPRPAARGAWAPVGSDVPMQPRPMP